MAEYVDPDLAMILDDLRQEFIIETRDKVQEIEQMIGAIQARDGSPTNNLMEIKRLMHTIKGGGGSFGFPTVSKIAHGFEDYLETSGQADLAAPDDLLVFSDAIAAILDAGQDPEDKVAHMLLRGLPSGRRQSGTHAVEKGLAMLLMPRGVQRKIIAQELAQLGFKVNIMEDPLQTIDTAITLQPDFLITTLHTSRINGLELSWVLNSIALTKAIRIAVVTADDITEELRAAVPPLVTLIKKGPTFSQEIMAFIRN